MENRGRVISCDIYDHKLALIRKTAEELKTLTEESLTEASDENQKERLEKIQKLTRELLRVSGAEK